MDLVFSLAERWSEAGAPAGIGGTVEFRTDVFDAASIEALIERFRRVVEAITADPTRPLSSIDLLDADEHARLDAFGNRAVLTAAGSTPVSVPELVAAQVARTPAAVAISFEGRSLTYREVEEAANRLAHLLAAHGVGPGQCVALLVERSAEAVVAMLAVLKAGAAYLAIDPALPDARIGFMLTDAAPIAAVTSTGLAARLDGYEVAVIEVDDPAIDSSTRHRVAGAGSRGYRLPHLHLGHHRHPEGGGRQPPQPGPRGGVDAPPPAGGAGVDAVSLVCFRLFGVGDLGCAAGWGAVGGGARSRWPVRRRISTRCWSASRSMC